MTGTTAAQTAHPKPPAVPYAGFHWPVAMDMLASHLPSELVTRATLASLAPFARQIPGLWHWGMFETRLQDGDHPVDVLSALLQHEDVRRALRETLGGPPHHELEAARGTLLAFAGDDPGGLAETPNLWLEWDRDESVSPPLPWLCIAPDFFDRRLSELSAEAIGSLATKFMDSSHDLHVSGAAERLVELARKLPKGGKLMGFASLRPRGKAVCRVFARLPAGQLSTWLNAIDWPGSRERLAEHEPLFRVEGEPQWCQIEFDSKVNSHLALELAQTERGFPRRAAREQWLDAVVDRGYAAREKAEAVLRWHGSTPCILPPGEAVTLLRSFHLKLVLPPVGAPVAKAYLGFYFRRPV